MKTQNNFGTNLIKAILVVLLCLIIIAIMGAGVTLTIVGFKATAVTIRCFVAVVLVTITILTIRTIINRTHFVGILQDLMNNIFNMKNSYERELYNKYNILMSKYPIAISQYESKCWKNGIKTSYEIMESATKIPDSEWEIREREARQNL